MLDYRFAFPQDVPLGSDCALSVSSTINSPGVKGPWVPPNVVQLNSLFITDSPAGRAGTETAIGNAIAGGILANYVTLYPNPFGLGNWQYPVWAAQDL